MKINITMYAYSFHIYIHTQNACIHYCTYTQRYIHNHTYTYTHTYIHMYLLTDLHMDAHLGACTRTFLSLTHTRARTPMHE